MTPALTHIAFHVRDLVACVAFYRDFCDLRVVHERGGDHAAIDTIAARAGVGGA